MKSPTGISLDIFGNLYVSDFDNHSIRKIDKFGIINTIAGNGTNGFGGDGGLAIYSTLYWPQKLVVDLVGNVFFADGGNNRIRKIDTSGIINTIIGNGSIGFSGDGGPAILAKLNGPADVKIEIGRAHV